MNDALTSEVTLGNKDMFEMKISSTSRPTWPKHIKDEEKDIQHTDTANSGSVQN